MRKRSALLAAAMILFCLRMSSAQGKDPFLTVPIEADVTFGALPYQASTVTVRAAVGPLSEGADPLNGTPVQVLPYSVPAAFDVPRNSRGTRLVVIYDAAGFVMFQDRSGGGVGWHIKNYLGWTIIKIQGSLVMDIELEGPFWLGDPPASVSATLVQMKAAGSATWLLPLQADQGTSLNDLVNVGQKGKFAEQPSVTFAAPGNLYLFQ